jgi:hypothetical protein
MRSVLMDTLLGFSSPEWLARSLSLINDGSLVMAKQYQRKRPAERFPPQPSFLLARVLFHAFNHLRRPKGRCSGNLDSSGVCRRKIMPIAL